MTASGWRRFLVVPGVIGLLGLVACTGREPGPPSPPDVPPTTVITALPARPTPSPTPVVRTVSQACGGEPFDARKVLPFRPDAPAYSGAGPHPAVLFKIDPFGDSYREDVEPRLPASWEPADGAAPQLVVCEHDDPAFRDRKVGECEYLGGDPKFY